MQRWEDKLIKKPWRIAPVAAASPHANWRWEISHHTVTNVFTVTRCLHKLTDRGQAGAAWYCQFTEQGSLSPLPYLALSSCTTPCPKESILVGRFGHSSRSLHQSKYSFRGGDHRRTSTASIHVATKIYP